MFTCSNTIFIGLPINMAIFGSRAVPYVLIYYIANTTFFWTWGVYKISQDSQTFAGLDDIPKKFGPGLNPARDLGPRILHAILPKSILGESKSDSKWWYAWVGVCAPILAAIVAIALFKLLYL